jgi:hypothetical protein
MPCKESDLVPTTQNTTDDARRQLNKFTATANTLLERVARLAEEYDNNRLATEEIREILGELVKEFGIWANGLSKRMDRQEEYVILVGMGKGDSAKARQITQEVSGEHLERGLREELAEQQRLLATYQRNLSKVQQQIAEMGYETIENMNKREDFERKIQRINEAISRIREALK